jgi:hypothetical protein
MCGGSEVQCSAPSIIFLATRKTPSAPPGAQESLTEWPRFESGWASEIFRRTSTERGGAGHSRGDPLRGLSQLVVERVASTCPEGAAVTESLSLSALPCSFGKSLPSQDRFS